MNKTYLVIDLKSFFASVECSLRGIDSMESKLVVADMSRGKGTICLAVSPKLKKMGVKNRCRFYEIPESILNDPELVIATPRMAKYIEYSSKIYKIYLKYIAKEDIHVYSIDECFIDVTNYLNLYKLTPKELAIKMMDDVYNTFGIRATCGIGTNMYLAKIALDITAKHAKDFIGYLDEELYKKELWDHEPLTDFWNVGPGITKRLLKYGIHNQRGIANIDEDILYKEFGVNALFLIDHAWGRESCTIKDIKNYKRQSNSVTNGQVLFKDYDFNNALLVLKEMIELNVLTLVDKHLVTNNISLMIGYSDFKLPMLGVSHKLTHYTNSYKELNDEMIDLYLKNVDRTIPIRRIGVSFNNVIDEIYESYTLFSNIEELEKEKNLQHAILDIKKKFGKNSILKGMNLEKEGTAIERNKLIGGHNAN